MFLFFLFLFPPLHIAHPFPQSEEFVTYLWISVMILCRAGLATTEKASLSSSSLLLPQNKLKYSSGFFALPKRKPIIGSAEFQKKKYLCPDDYGIFERTNVELFPMGTGLRAKNILSPELDSMLY